MATAPPGAAEGPGDPERPGPVLPTRAVALVFAAFCGLLALWRSADGVSQGSTFTVALYLQSLATVCTIYGTAFVAVSGAARFAPSRPAVRAALLMSTVTAGIAAGWWLATGPAAVAARWQSGPQEVLLAPLGFLGIGLLGVALLLMAERADAMRTALDGEWQRQAELARAVAEAQVSLLQSQVEPHFLFNTLAHLRRLYATEPAAGRAMLQDLRRYLGDARPALRRGTITLEEDADLALAYLNLHKVRMGDRLAFGFELPADTLHARLPPMALTTLVENSIEHGLASLPSGGAIHVWARRCGPAVHVEVVDDGRGLQTSFGGGVGLANLRARLETLHGRGARLELAQRATGGVRATIVVPAPGATA